MLTGNDHVIHSTKYAHKWLLSLAGRKPRISLISHVIWDWYKCLSHYKVKLCPIHSHGHYAAHKWWWDTWNLKFHFITRTWNNVVQPVSYHIVTKSLIMEQTVEPAKIKYHWYWRATTTSIYLFCNSDVYNKYFGL